MRSQIWRNGVTAQKWPHTLARVCKVAVAGLLSLLHAYCCMLHAACMHGGGAGCWQHAAAQQRGGGGVGTPCRMELLGAHRLVSGPVGGSGGWEGCVVGGAHVELRTKSTGTYEARRHLVPCAQGEADGGRGRGGRADHCDRAAARPKIQHYQRVAYHPRGAGLAAAAEGHTPRVAASANRGLVHGWIALARAPGDLDMY